MAKIQIREAAFDVVTKVKTNWKLYGRIALAVVVILLIVFNAFQYSKIQTLKIEAKMSSQNLLAMADSLKTEKQKNGAMQTSIAGFVASEKDLKTLNRDLYDEVHAQQGKVVSLSKALIQLKQDTAMLRSHIDYLNSVIGRPVPIDSNTFSVPWTLAYKYDTLNWDKFEGQTIVKVTKKTPLELTHINTKMLNRTSQISLVWGQKVEDKSLRVFIQSTYPGFTVEQLSGVLIDPNTNPYIKKLIKKKHWFTGFGIGLGVTGGFNITQGGYGFVVGPSFTYNIFQW